MDYKAIVGKCFIEARFGDKPERFSEARIGKVKAYLGEVNRGHLDRYIFLIAYRLETGDDVLMPEEIVELERPHWTLMDSWEDLDSFVEAMKVRQENS